jgi:Uma2 family endonuclease
MSQPYEEIVEGETLRRVPPGERHEAICERLHTLAASVVSQLPSTRLLPARSIIQLAPGTFLRPDLALVTAATGKLWLVAEVVHASDHHVDTVVKKAIYEECRVPRLWMIDPRYDNAEVYHDSKYGLVLKGILAGSETLTESLLPAFRITMTELFLE